ncbi:MAG: archaeal proteasome endopeptidase complex subunit beta [Desulfurococcales archaeon]|nr:archaeal proteasome endopeptidase complex subunit beta [Desulfurococcales archaeon]
MATPFGATAVAVRVKDGVVLAADRRMSYGGFIVSKNIKKIYKISDRIAIAITGLYGDMSGIMRILDVEVRYYEISSERPMSLQAVAKLFSNLLYSYRVMPLYVEALVGGIDLDGKPKIYVLDPVGALTEEDYAAAGSGATIALGVIESSYKPDLSLDEAEKLVENAMKAAISRDAGSGDAIDIVRVTREGISERTVKLRVVGA